MKRLTAAAVLTLCLASCGSDEPKDFVSWATSEGGLDQETAECVEPQLSDAHRDALTDIEADTPEDEIDPDAVDALTDAALDCTFAEVGTELDADG